MAQKLKTYGFGKPADVTRDRMEYVVNSDSMDCLTRNERLRVREEMAKVLKECCPADGLVHQDSVKRCYDALSEKTFGLRPQKLEPLRAQLKQLYTEIRTAQKPRVRKTDAPATVAPAGFSLVQNNTISDDDMTVELDTMRSHFIESISLIDGIACSAATGMGSGNIGDIVTCSMDRIADRTEPTVTISRMAERLRDEKIENDPLHAELVQFINTSSPLEDWDVFQRNHAGDGMPLPALRLAWQQQWQAAAMPRPAVTAWIMQEVKNMRAVASDDVLRALGSPSQLAHLIIGAAMLYSTRLYELARSASRTRGSAPAPKEWKLNVEHMQLSGLLLFMQSLQGLPWFRAVESGGAFTNFLRVRRKLGLAMQDMAEFHGDPKIKRMHVMDLTMEKLQRQLQTEVIPALAGKYNFFDLARAARLCEDHFPPHVALEEGIDRAEPERPPFYIAYLRPLNRSRPSDGLVSIHEHPHLCQKAIHIGDHATSSTFDTTVFQRGDHVYSVEKLGLSTMLAPPPVHMPRYAECAGPILRASAVLSRHIDRVQEKFPAFFSAACYSGLSFLEHDEAVYVGVDPEDLVAFGAACPDAERMTGDLGRQIFNAYGSKNTSMICFRLCPLSEVATATAIRERILTGVVLPTSDANKEALLKGDGEGFKRTLRKRREIIREIIIELELEGETEISHGKVDKTMLRFAKITEPESYNDGHDGHLGYEVVTIRSLMLQILVCDVDSEGTFLVFESNHDADEFTDPRNEKSKLRKDLGAVTAPHFHTRDQWQTAMINILENAGGKSAGRLYSMAHTGRKWPDDCSNEYGMDQAQTEALRDDLTDIAEVINERLHDDLTDDALRRLDIDPREVQPWQLTLSHMLSIHPGDVFLRFRGDQGSESGNSYLFNMAVYLGLAPSVVQAMKQRGCSKKTLGIIQSLAFPEQMTIKSLSEPVSV